MAHVGPMWVDVGKSHFLVMVICPSGAQMGYMWCIWALVSPGKTQMGPRSFASWVYSTSRFPSYTIDLNKVSC